MILRTISLFLLCTSTLNLFGQSYDLFKDDEDLYGGDINKPEIHSTILSKSSIHDSIGNIYIISSQKANKLRQLYGIQQKNGKLIYPCIFEKVSKCDNKYLIVKTEASHGLLDLKGNSIIPIQIGTIKPLKDSYFILNKGSLLNYLYKIEKNKSVLLGEPFFKIFRDDLIPFNIIGVNYLNDYNAQYFDLKYNKNILKATGNNIFPIDPNGDSLLIFNQNSAFIVNRSTEKQLFNYKSGIVKILSKKPLILLSCLDSIYSIINKPQKLVYPEKIKSILLENDILFFQSFDQTWKCMDLHTFKLKEDFILDSVMKIEVDQYTYYKFKQNGKWGICHPQKGTDELVFDIKAEYDSIHTDREMPYIFCKNNTQNKIYVLYKKFSNYSDYNNPHILYGDTCKLIEPLNISNAKFLQTKMRNCTIKIGNDSCAVLEFRRDIWFLPFETKITKLPYDSIRFSNQNQESRSLESHKKNYIVQRKGLKGLIVINDSSYLELVQCKYDQLWEDSKHNLTARKNEKWFHLIYNETKMKYEEIAINHSLATSWSTPMTTNSLFNEPKLTADPVIIDSTKKGIYIIGRKDPNTGQNLYGIQIKKDRILFPCVFTSINPLEYMNDGKGLKVNLNSKVGLIDDYGNILLGFENYNIYTLKDNFIYSLKDNKSYIYELNHSKLRFIAGPLGSLSTNFLLNNKIFTETQYRIKGCFDLSTGKQTIENKFDYLNTTSFKDTLDGIVQHRHYLVDATNGKHIWKNSYLELSQFNKKTFWVKTETNDLLIDVQEKVLPPGAMTNAFLQGKFFFFETEGQGWRVMEPRTLSTYPQYKFEKLKPFLKLLIVQQNKKKGVLSFSNDSLKSEMACIYDSIYTYQELPYLFCQKGRKWDVWATSRMKKVLQNLNWNPELFSSKNNEVFISIGKDSCAIMNHDYKYEKSAFGIRLTKLPFSEISNASYINQYPKENEPVYVVTKNGLRGLISLINDQSSLANFKELAPCAYNQLIVVQKQDFIAQRNNKWYYLTYKHTTSKFEEKELK